MQWIGIFFKKGLSWAICQNKCWVLVLTRSFRCLKNSVTLHHWGIFNASCLTNITLLRASKYLKRGTRYLCYCSSKCISSAPSFSSSLAQTLLETVNIWDQPTLTCGLWLVAEGVNTQQESSDWMGTTDRKVLSGKGRDEPLKAKYSPYSFSE